MNIRIILFLLLILAIVLANVQHNRGNKRRLHRRRFWDKH